MTAPVMPKAFGRYQILKEIGTGGTAIVYKAHDPQLDRVVALKVLKPKSEQVIDEMRQRFIQEAKSTANLHHPNIIKIYDTGIEGKSQFFTMTFIEGPSLQDLIEMQWLEIPQSIEIMVKIAEAIHYAHCQGVIHRDIKPENVMMDEDEPKVMDFGLAKIKDSEAKLSQEGTILGTVHYMPPEQATGQSDEIDERSDVYSLGAMFYEMLSGNPPFEASSSMEIIYKITNESPIPLRKFKPAITPYIEAVCAKAMHKKKEQRYQSAAEFAAALAKISGQKLRVSPTKNSSPANERKKTTRTRKAKSGKNRKYGTRRKLKNIRRKTNYWPAISGFCAVLCIGIVFWWLRLPNYEQTGILQNGLSKTIESDPVNRTTGPSQSDSRKNDEHQQRIKESNWVQNCQAFFAQIPQWVRTRQFDTAILSGKKLLSRGKKEPKEIYQGVEEACYDLVAMRDLFMQTLPRAIANLSAKKVRLVLATGKTIDGEVKKVEQSEFSVETSSGTQSVKFIEISVESVDGLLHESADGRTLYSLAIVFFFDRPKALKWSRKRMKQALEKGEQKAIAWLRKIENKINKN